MDPSYPIVFYVSGHGFGHTSRVIEVIHAVLRARPGVRIAVKTAAPRVLFERTLAGRIDLVELECDAGVVQRDSLSIDAAKTVRRAKAFQARLPALAAAEAAFLKKSAVRLVVGDIPPLAFAAAEAAGVPSIGIGNFTWDWIYEGYPEEAPEDLARDVRRAYEKATLMLRLPMSAGFTGLDTVTRDIPFIARRSNRAQNDVRLTLGLAPRPAGKPLVLMSFGRYGVDGLDARALAALDEYVIATTIAPPPGSHEARNVLYISEQQLLEEGLQYQDLVRAADVVVATPGYGIISEAIANDTALLYTSRGRFVEYDVLVNEMPRFLRAQFLEQEDLLNGKWAAALESLLHQPRPPRTAAFERSGCGGGGNCETNNEERIRNKAGCHDLAVYSFFVLRFSFFRIECDAPMPEVRSPTPTRARIRARREHRRWLHRRLSGGCVPARR